LVTLETYSKSRLCDSGRGRCGFGRAGIVCAHDGGSERNGSTNCKTHCACLLSRIDQRSWVGLKWRKRVHGLKAWGKLVDKYVVWTPFTLGSGRGHMQRSSICLHQPLVAPCAQRLHMPWMILELLHASDSWPDLIHFHLSNSFIVYSHGGLALIIQAPSRTRFRSSFVCGVLFSAITSAHARLEEQRTM
jgi:hypothetical protein